MCCSHKVFRTCSGCPQCFLQTSCGEWLKPARKPEIISMSSRVNAARNSSERLWRVSVPAHASVTGFCWSFLLLCNVDDTFKYISTQKQSTERASRMQQTKERLHRETQPTSCFVFSYTGVVLVRTHLQQSSLLLYYWTSICKESQKKILWCEKDSDCDR